MKFKFALGIVITMIFSVIITIDVLYMPLKLAFENSGNFFWNRQHHRRKLKTSIFSRNYC